MQGQLDFINMAYTKKGKREVCYFHPSMTPAAQQFIILLLSSVSNKRLCLLGCVMKAVVQF